MTVAAVEKKGNGLILVGLMLGVFLFAVDQAVVGPSLPKIVSDLQDFEHFASLLTAFLLASTIVVPLAGKFSDTLGRRPIYLMGMGTFLIGSMLCGLAGEWGDWHFAGITVSGMSQLILFRFIQGLGGGAIFPVALATIADLYAPGERGRVQGLFGAVFGLSSVVGPFLGGWIVDNMHLFNIASWRWVFYVNLPIGLIGMTLVFNHFPAPVRRPHQIDWLGIISMTTLLVSVVLVATLGGGSYAWASAQIFGLIALAVIALIVFVLVERKHPDPIIPLSLFKEPIFTVCVIAAALMGAAMFGVISFMPTYMQGIVGISATYSGAVLMPLSLTLVAGSIISGNLVKKVGYKIFIVSGPVLAGGAFAWLYYLTTQGIPPVWLAIVVMMVLGLGIGFTLQTFVIAVQNAIEKKLIGVGTSSVVLFRSIGATLGIAALGAILNRKLESTLPNTMPPGSIAALMSDPRAHLTRLADFPRLLTTPEFMNAQFPGHDAIVAGLRTGFNESIASVWLAGAIIVAVAFVVTLFLRSKPLKTPEEYLGEKHEPAAPAMH